MIDVSTDYGTDVVQHAINMLACVYTAFADANERATWGAPSDTATFIYEETNFKTGGLDLARCGPKEDPRFAVVARYVDIVAEKRVVSIETISESDTLLAVKHLSG